MHKIFIKADRPCSGQLQIMGARSESMTNYRRLISYIYAYEGEVKGKNIGFAKLESRNGQCKLSVNVKKVYVGSSDLGVYLLAPGKEIFLGSIFIRSGGGEFRAVVNVENAADSGCSMDQCYGLTIHEQGDTWRAYTTIWEDAVAHAAEVELADVTSSKVGDAEAQIHRKVEELNQELRSGEKAAEGGDGPVLSSSPAEARQMSAGRGAMKNAETPEGAEVVQETEVLAQTSEEVYQTENEANQMTEALAGKIDNADYRVYSILGDGELEEGQVWEAAMFAGFYKLNNLTAFVDFNGLQIDGDITKVLSPLPIPEKFKAFNWNVIEVNGHDLDELHNAIETAKAFTEGPTCIIMHTVKGKGVEEMEGQAGWHGKAPSEEQGVAFVNEIMGVQ